MENVRFTLGELLFSADWNFQKTEMKVRTRNLLEAERFLLFIEYSESGPFFPIVCLCSSAVHNWVKHNFAEA